MTAAPKSRAARSLAGVLAVTICALVGSCARDHDPAAPRDIVLITVDTLRADHLSLYGYARQTTPQLEHWFKTARVFDPSYATSSFTAPSIVSLLTGLPPREHRVRLLNQLVPDTSVLLTQLLPAEYQTAAFVANTVLSDAAIGVADRFDHYDDGDWPENGADSPVYLAENVTGAALRWLREERDPARPLFLWVHYLDPHAPYRAPANWAPRFSHTGQVPIPEGRVPKIAHDPTRTDALDYVDAYDEEIAYTDHHIGRLLDGYSAATPIDDALVIFTSDHGESMIERSSWFAHMWNVFEEIVRVPLLIRGPGVTPGRTASSSSGVDIAPTILRFAGATVPPEMKGRDLLGDAVAGSRPVFFETSMFETHMSGVISGDEKWIARLRSGDRSILGRRRYDLARDPGERTRLGWRPDSDVRRILEERIATDPDPGGKPTDLQSGLLVDQTHDALRELGYIE